MENILTGVNFMLIGLTTVFLFLWFLVGTISLMRTVISRLNKYFPEAAEPSASLALEDNMNEAVLAIAAAYSKKNKKV